MKLQADNSVFLIYCVKLYLGESGYHAQSIHLFLWLQYTGKEGLFMKTLAFKTGIKILFCK